MKNKKTTYVLLPIVLAVWGMIGWKVCAGFSGDSDSGNHPKLALKDHSITALIPDTYQLLNNYRDPFLGKIQQKELPKKSVVSNIPKPEVDPPPSAVWPKLSYQGLIRRNEGEKMVGFLVVNGNTCLVNSGDVVNDLKVVWLKKDSIGLEMGKERRVVRK